MHGEIFAAFPWREQGSSTDHTAATMKRQNWIHSESKNSRYFYGPHQKYHGPEKIAVMTNVTTTMAHCLSAKLSELKYRQLTEWSRKYMSLFVLRSLGYSKNVFFSMICIYFTPLRRLSVHFHPSVFVVFVCDQHIWKLMAELAWNLLCTITPPPEITTIRPHFGYSYITDMSVQCWLWK